MLHKLITEAGVGIDPDIVIPHIKPYIEDNMSVTSSSGSSIVFIGENTAVQYFKSPHLTQKIEKNYKKIMLNSPMFKEINYIPPYISRRIKEKMISEGKELPVPEKCLYIIPVSNYIVPIISVYKHVIIWKKIRTLNTMNNLANFIIRNIEKLMWDIMSSLTVIHDAGVIHGDATIDNIGIYNGNFVLFDFDSSKTEGENTDIRTFERSLNFNTNNNYNYRVNTVVSMISNYMVKHSATCMEALNHFVYLQIKYD